MIFLHFFLSVTDPRGLTFRYLENQKKTTVSCDLKLA